MWVSKPGKIDWWLIRVPIRNVRAAEVELTSPPQISLQKPSLKMTHSDIWPQGSGSALVVI